MKIYLAIPILVLLALSSSVTGQVPSQKNGSDADYGKAFLVGTVDVRTPPQPHQASTGKTVQIQLGSGPQASSSPSSTFSPLSASDPLTFSTVSTRSSVKSTFGFNGTNANQSGGFPVPDVQVAAGPNYLVEMANVLGTIYTRQGGLVQTINLYQLFKAPDLSDPKVLFDNSSRRWFAAIITSPSPNFTPGNVTVAVSTSSDPFIWNVYNICPGQGGTCPSKTYLPDQPILGVSDDKVTIGANDYASSFVGAQYWVLNKNQMLSSAQTVAEYSHGPDGRFFSIHPVQSLGSTTTQYMVSTGNCCSSNVTFFSITGVPPGSVTNSTVVLPISTMTSPPNGVEPLTLSMIDARRNGSESGCPTTTSCPPPPSPTIDLHSSNRVQSAVWFKGILWYSANDACIPPGDSTQRSCVRLTEINTGTTSVTQDFDYAANATYYFYPALSMDSSGNLDVIYGYSSSTTYPSLAITGQSIADLSGTLAPALTIKKGTAPVTTGRYGDYFGAGTDPSNSTIVWVAGEYGNATSSGWATFIASMNLRLVSDFSISPNPASISTSTGTPGTSTISVSSVNGFAGSVSLSVPLHPTATSTARLNVTSVTLTTSSSAHAGLTVTDTFAERFNLTVTGAGGGKTHTVPVPVTVSPVGDFSMSTDCDYISFNTCSQSIITMTSLNGFTGIVSLSATASPSTGITPHLTPGSVSLPAGGSANSTLTVSTTCSQTICGWKVNVTGTSGPLSHSISISICRGRLCPLAFTPYPPQTAVSAAGATSAAVWNQASFGGRQPTAGGLDLFMAETKVASLRPE